jgi:hypothetical protein
LKYLDGGFCKIRNEQTDINIINNNRASCYSPSVSQPSIEDLYVCSKSLHCILAAAVTFQQMPFVALSAARFDWCSQNILVDVFGKHLEDALCVFSQNLWKDTFTPRLISSTHILCKARVHQFEAGRRTLELLSNDIDILVHNASCAYDMSPRISSIFPTQLIKMQNSIAVTVHGRNFAETAELSCKVGEKVSAGQFLTPSKILCSVLGSLHGNMTVEVSLDGAFFTTQGVTLAVSPARCSFQLIPSMGVESGGTICRIQQRDTTEGMDGLRFGKSEYVSPVSSTGMVTTPPSTFNSKNILVEAYVSGLPSACFTNFVYSDEAHLELVVPSAGNEQGGSQMTLIGRNFASHCELKAQDAPIPVMIVSSTLAVCTSPAHAAGSLTLSYDCGDHLSSTFYQVTKKPEVLFVEPSQLFLEGYEPETAKLVALTGQNFVQTRELSCKASNQHVAATWISSTRILCMVTARTAGNVTLSMSNNGAEFSESITLTVSVVAAVVHHIFPSAFQSRADATISVIGEGFSPNNVMRCHASARELVCEYISISLVLCKIPAWQTSPGALQVQVGHNGLILKEVQIWIRNPPLIQRVTPGAGGGEGGTLIRIQGRFLDGNVVECVFATILSPAAVHSSTYIMCVSPQIYEDTPFSVTVDGIEAEEARKFLHVPVPVLTTLSPPIAFYANEKRVDILGSNFKDLETLQCKFGNMYTSSAVYHSDAHVSCFVPSFGIRNVSVAISNNGQDFSAPLTLQVIQAPSISAVYPSIGPSQGGIRVRVYVRDLSSKLTPYYSDIRCRFGLIDVHAALQDGGNSLLCVVPGKIANSTVQISVVEDGRLLVNNSITFLYKAASKINGVVPSVGPISGSTVVTLAINDFSAPITSSCVCLFGDKSVPAQIRLNSSAVTCKTPSVSMPGFYYVSLFCNGYDIRGSDGFQFVGDMVIAGFFPTVGQIPATTMITIFGSGFQELDTLTCKFGEHGRLSRASLVSSTAVSCQSRTQIPGNASLSLSYNVNDWSKAPYPFLSIRRSEVIYIQPTSGSNNGGTMVTVRGLPIQIDQSQFCVFGTVSVHMIAMSSSVGQCLSPARNVGAVKFVLETKDTKERTLPTKFLYVSPQQVYSLMPSLGKTMGNTLVSVMGSNFRNSDDVGCRFGRLRVNATFINSEMLLCRSPRHTPQILQVEVTNNGQDFSKNEARFLYDDVQVNSISPISGPIAGGTQIRIRTVNLLQTSTLSCMVGSTKMQMQRASALEAWCVTPPTLVEGYVEISVSTNEQEYFTAGVRFNYQAAIRVSGVAPSFGGVQGNTKVMVMGSGFIDSRSLGCQFGVIRRDVHRFLSSKQIECISPSSDVGSVNVGVANNAIDFVSSQTRYEYHPMLELHYLEPSAGVMRGSTAVTFTGINFRKTPSFGCRVGSVVVKADWLSNVRGYCSTPRAPRFGQYHFEVTSNGVDFTNNGLLFDYYDPVQITSIHPSIAPASTGHTLVTIRVLSAPLSVSPSWKCIFGSLQPQHSMPAVVISSEMLQCVAPMSAVGEVPFLLSRNGQDLEGGHGKSFHFIEDTTLLGLKPNSGLTSGGTTIFLFGANIRNNSDLVCRFGSSLTPATYLSQALAICSSPPQAPGSVDVELSSAKISWTNSRLLFTYLLCPQGSFCPGTGVILPCPAGSYCDLDRSINHTLCPPSTFQPSLGQTSCLLCPSGRFCAEEGLVSPGVPCVAGYVCESKGLRAPEIPCPPGHFCLRGTLTSDATSRKTKNKPHPCPGGFYCTYGVKTPVSEATNFSTPQPCIPGYFCSRGSETPHGQGPCPSGYHCPTYAPGVAKVCGPGEFCPGVANTVPLHCAPGTSNRFNFVLHSSIIQLIV